MVFCLFLVSYCTHTAHFPCGPGRARRCCSGRWPLFVMVCWPSTPTIVLIGTVSFLARRPGSATHLVSGGPVVETPAVAYGPARSDPYAAPVWARLSPVAGALAGLRPCPSMFEPHSNSAFPSAAISLPVPFPQSDDSTTCPRMTSPATMQVINQGLESALGEITVRTPSRTVSSTVSSLGWN